MEYSFSQTFGKSGPYVMQQSPTQSFHSSQKKDSGISHSSSRSFEGRNDHSPLIDTYPTKLRKQRLHQDISNQNFSGYIRMLAKQSKQYNHHSKYKQNIHKQKQAKFQAEIKHVDGINQRMSNLIRQLKRDYSLNPKNIKHKEQIKIVDNSNRYSQAKIDKKLDRSHSTEAFRRFNNSFFSRQSYQKYDKYSKYNLSHNKQVPLQYQSRSKQKMEDRIKSKFFKQESLSIDNYSTIRSNKKIQNLKPHNLGTIIESEQKYQINPYNQYQNKYPNLNNGGRSCGEIQYRYKNYQRQPQKQKSVSKSYQIEEFKQNWLKNKVKTIQSQIQTNYNDNRQVNNMDSINQFSFVQENEDIKYKTKDADSIYMNLFDRKNGKNLSINIKQNEIKQKTQYSTKQYSKSYEMNIKPIIKQKDYGSKGFDTKIKRISQKIQIYQKKIVELGGLSKYCSKNNFQYYKINQNIYQDNLVTTKGNKKYDRKQETIKKDEKIKHQSYLQTIKIQDKQNILPQFRIQQKNIGNKSYQRKFSQVSAMPNQTKNKLQNKTQFKIYQDIQINRQLKNTESYKQINSSKKTQQYVKKPKNNDVYSLKQRMSNKLCLTNAASKIVKQIQLDQQFRKIKKQFSKLPQNIPGIIKDKWQHLQNIFKAKIKKLPQLSIFSKIVYVKELFQLTDQEADPFFSIAIQNLRDYQEITKCMVQSCIKSQSYFYQNLLNKFTVLQIQCLFSTKQKKSQLIMLDQMTLSLSNATKISHKCRDIYLIFKRIIRYSRKQKKQNGLSNTNIEYIKIQDLLNVFSQSEQNSKQTIRKAKDHQNEYRNYLDDKKSKNIFLNQNGMLQTTNENISNYLS